MQWGLCYIQVHVCMTFTYAKYGSYGSIGYVYPFILISGWWFVNVDDHRTIRIGSVGHAQLPV